MSAGILRPPQTLWILLDVSNGDFPVKCYTWWFTSRQAARDHKKEQASNPDHAALTGPFKYQLIAEDSAVLPYHEYDCKFWRIGKSHGPCTCRKLRGKKR